MNQGSWTFIDQFILLKMSHEEYKSPKLNGENYHVYSIRARASLVQKHSWEAVDPGFGADMKEKERRKK